MNEKADQYKHLESQLNVLMSDYKMKAPEENLEHLGQILEFAAKMYELVPEVWEEQWARIKNDYPLGKRNKQFNAATKLMQQRWRLLNHLIEQTKNSMLWVHLYSSAPEEGTSSPF